MFVAAQGLHNRWILLLMLHADRYQNSRCQTVAGWPPLIDRGQVDGFNKLASWHSSLVQTGPLRCRLSFTPSFRGCLRVDATDTDLKDYVWY